MTVRDMIGIERDPELVLTAPQHYHVTVITYEATSPEGVFQWSTEHNLIANDVPLAVDRAKRLADKHRAHVRTITQCADPAHLDGLDLQ